MNISPFKIMLLGGLLALSPLAATAQQQGFPSGNGANVFAPGAPSAPSTSTTLPPGMANAPSAPATTITMSQDNLIKALTLLSQASIKATPEVAGLITQAEVLLSPPMPGR